MLRKAIAVHHTATIAEPWDAGMMMKRMGEPSAADLKLMHAWMDPDGDPEAKSSYKFPHHMVDEGGKVGEANMKACSSAMGALNGARGGASIPDADRPGVHAHIAAHMMDGDMEPPEMNAIKPGMIEYRSFDVMELRIADEEGAPPRMVGHAAVFNSLSDMIAGAFREQIQPGAFKKTIREADIRALWNHNPDYVLGRTRAKTLSLAEDERGLAFEIIPPETTWAKDLMISMERGDVNQMSFGFQVPKNGDSWGELGDGTPVRTLREIKLLDVSPVTFPAYPQTEAFIRSTIDALRRYLPPEPAPAGHSEEPDERYHEPRKHSLESIRRRLELARRI